MKTNSRFADRQAQSGAWSMLIGCCDFKKGLENEWKQVFRNASAVVADRDANRGNVFFRAFFSKYLNGTLRWRVIHGVAYNILEGAAGHALD